MLAVPRALKLCCSSACRKGLEVRLFDGCLEVGDLCSSTLRFEGLECRVCTDQWAWEGGVELWKRVFCAGHFGLVAGVEGFLVSISTPHSSNHKNVSTRVFRAMELPKTLQKSLQDQCRSCDISFKVQGLRKP